MKDIKEIERRINLLKQCLGIIDGLYDIAKELEDDSRLDKYHKYTLMVKSSLTQLEWVLDLDDAR